MRLLERIAYDPVLYAMRVLILLSLFGLCLLLFGCASDRYLTEAEDAQLRQKCEATGCAVIPMPLWQQIEKLIQSMRGA